MIMLNVNQGWKGYVLILLLITKQCPDFQIYDWKPEPKKGNAVELDCNAEGDSKTKVYMSEGFIRTPEIYPLGATWITLPLNTN
jgi:hypothetical protein